MNESLRKLKLSNKDKYIVKSYPEGIKRLKSRDNNNSQMTSSFIFPKIHKPSKKMMRYSQINKSSTVKNFRERIQLEADINSNE